MSGLEMLKIIGEAPALWDDDASVGLARGYLLIAEVPA